MPCQRTDQPGTQGFIASHDGYVARFSLYHERELSLSDGGNVLAGIDRFLRSGGAAARNNGRDFVTVRFHLHPDVELFQDEQDRLVLTAPNADRWVIPATRSRPSIEELIYFAGLGGPRRSRQIVLAFKASEFQEVHWQLTRTHIAGLSARSSDQLSRARSLISWLRAATAAAISAAQTERPLGMAVASKKIPAPDLVPVRRALLSVSDKTGLVGIRRGAFQGRRGAGLDRRHGEGDRGGRHRRARRVRADRLSRDHGRPRQDAASGRAWRAARRARRSRTCRAR